MKTALGAHCDDFYVSTRLFFKLDLKPARESLLHFFERIRREYPALCRMRRRDRKSVTLEEQLPAHMDDAGPRRWVRIESAAMRLGYYSPPGIEALQEFSHFVLQQAPYHLTLSELDVDHLEVVYGFDLEYAGNHDQLVAETLFASHPLAQFALGHESRHTLDCQPFFGIALTPECDLQAHLEIKSRSSTYEIRTGEYEAQALSVYLTVRRYWSFTQPSDLAEAHATLLRHAQELAAEHAVPLVVNPLAQAIASRP
jgi:hypothetical protein